MQRIQLNRTLLMQLVFTVAAFAVMVVLSYVFMSTIVRSSLTHNADSVLGFAEERISSHTFKLQSEFERAAETVRNMILQGNTTDTLEKYINDISYFIFQGTKTAEGGRGLSVYCETMPGGSVFIRSGLWTSTEKYKPEEHQWYQLAVASDGDTIETVPYYRAGSDDALLAYAKVIKDNQGRRLGVVCFEAQIGSIGREVVSTALNMGGYGMLLDQNLLILSHPNAEFIKKNLRSPDIPVAIFADELLHAREVLERPLTSYKGEDALAFFRKLSNGWYLGLVTPRESYYQSISSMATSFSVLGVALAATLCLILIRLDSARSRSDEESRRKSMFLANMSHEIRTPINAIIGMTAIGRVAINEERKNYCFAKIDNASKHLLGVINDILDISKIEANKIEISPTEFIFEKMLQQVVNVINFRIDEKHQKLTIHIEQAIPRTLVADEQRLAQVITNLLSNAVKFTPEFGSISLKARLLGEDDAFCTIEMEVTDSGIGITPEQRAKLFRPFQQAESHTTRKYGGTGLGLAISKSIVEIMGGEIRVMSESGQGTTFTFTVRVKRGESEQRDLGYQKINWSSIRILAVDDDPDILVYFQEILSNFGASCEVAGNAQEALRLFERHGEYDICFVDLRMPDVDGISLAREIRAREQRPGNSLIIMISSADLKELETEAKEAGVDKFLLKPLFPSTIFDVISECIGIANNKTEEAPVDINGIFAGRRILFAEDVDINREIVLTLLESTGLRIDCAENGVEAVRMFSEAPEQYDMIFMDVQMPVMDGYEASRQIRAMDHPKAGIIPIVAMTAHVFKEDIADCLAAGMNGHLGKPIYPNTLLETLIKYLKKEDFQDNSAFPEAI